MKTKLEKFVDGLKIKDGFECRKCGKCCHGNNLEIAPEDVIKMEENNIDISNINVHHYNGFIYEAKIQFTDTGNCPYWDKDTKLCIIHPFEPRVCKLFPYCLEQYFPKKNYNSDKTYYKIIRKPCLKERETKEYYWIFRDCYRAEKEEDVF